MSGDLDTTLSLSFSSKIPNLVRFTLNSWFLFNLLIELVILSFLIVFSIKLSNLFIKFTESLSFSIFWFSLNDISVSFDCDFVINVFVNLFFSFLTGKPTNPFVFRFCFNVLTMLLLVDEFSIISVEWLTLSLSFLLNVVLNLWISLSIKLLTKSLLLGVLDIFV